MHHARCWTITQQTKNGRSNIQQFPNLLMGPRLGTRLNYGTIYDSWFLINIRIWSNNVYGSWFLINMRIWFNNVYDSWFLINTRIWFNNVYDSWFLINMRIWSNNIYDFRFLINMVQNEDFVLFVDFIPLTIRPASPGQISNRPHNR